MLSVDAVQVWLIRSDQPVAVLDELAAVLDDEERARADMLRRAADRRRFVVAHGAARMIVGRLLGAPADQIRWRRGPHGKPELCGAWTGAQVNLSHSGDLNALAITESRRVGVDVQQVLHTVDPCAMAARFFPSAEARFVAEAMDPIDRARRFGRLWTRKEACVKACGSTLAKGLPMAAQGRSDVVLGRPSSALPGPFRVRDVRAPAGFCASVALEGAGAYRVERHWWRG
jgi:4'-phosphopantetheinyl transferase